MPMPDEHDLQRSRHARIPMHSMVLVSRGVNAWTSEIENISATGVLILRPEDWSGNAGDTCALDLLFGDDLHIHLEASVVRVTQEFVGFAYTHIPEHKESALWTLLGRFADQMEKPSED